MKATGNARPFTKSDYLAGKSCPKLLWLSKHQREALRPPSLADQHRMRTGQEIGALARTRDPDGVLVRSEPGNYEQAVLETQRAIDTGASVIFEATFVAAGRLARVDVLRRLDDGQWAIEEVKSSTLKDLDELFKKGLVHDLAFQMLTLKHAGLDIIRASLVLVDRAYAYAGGDVEPGLFFATVDLTETIESIRADVELETETLMSAMAGGQPEIETNKHCKDCACYDHCHENQPPHDVVFLPRLPAAKVVELRQAGYHTIDRIPLTHKLSPVQSRIRDVVVTGDPYVGDGLGDALNRIASPAAFIDFEAISPAIPSYLGTVPYTQVCFQWSAHVVRTSDGEADHLEWLACDGTDPRPMFCETLWQAVKDCKTIVFYTAFETTTLREMTAAGVPFAAELAQALSERGVDLARIVAEHVYLAEFNGQTSIKAVLPALAPGLTYKGMRVSDGTAAAAAFFQMLGCQDPAERGEIREALLEYCKLDTYAMVKVYRALRELSEARRLTAKE
jgi:hypothetical protein